MRRGLLALLLLTVICMPCVAHAAPPAETPDEGSKDAVRLDEVRVVATPVIHGNTVDRYGATTSTVGEEQIRDLNALDIASALRRSPGVTITRYNPVGAFGGAEGGAVFIRGMGSSRPGSSIKTFIDGVPVYMGVWNHPLLDLLPIDPASRIDVIKGPQPHRMGNAIAGIDITPKTGAESEYSTAVQVSGGSYGTFAQSLEHLGTAGSFDYALGEGYRRSDGHRSGGDGQAGSLFANLGYDINDNWDVSLFSLAVQNSAGDPGPDTDAESEGTYHSGMRMATLTLANDFGALDGELKFFMNAGDIDWEDQSGRHDDTLANFWFYGFMAHENWHPVDGLTLTAGIDQNWWDGNFSETNDDGSESSTLMPEFSLTMPYISASWLIGTDSGWHVIPSAGVRYYSHNKFDDANAPFAGIVAGYGDTEVHASFSKGVVYPGLDAVALGFKGWEDLDPEEVLHGEVGIRHTFNSLVQADLTFFNDDGKDRYTFSFPARTWENTESYHVQGLEATVTVTPSDDLALFASLTALDTHPSDMPYAPENTISAGVNWQFAENWKLSMDAEYVDDMHAMKQTRVEGQSNTQSVDDHFLLNAKLSHFFTLPQFNAGGEVFLAVENITDEDYEYQPDYPMPGINAMLGARITF